MKVSKLIELLSKFDKDLYIEAKCRYCDPEEGMINIYFDIDKVKQVDKHIVLEGDD